MRAIELMEMGTVAGAVATVAKPMGETQKRSVKVAGLEPAEKVMNGKSKNKEKKVNEAELSEDDVILVPGQGRKFKTGFVPKGQSRLDHEVEMARSDLFQAAKNAQKVYQLIKHLSEDEGLDGWVQEKIIKANDYLNTVREYLEHKTYMQEMSGGVIAAGGVGESK